MVLIIVVAALFTFAVIFLVHLIGRSSNRTQFSPKNTKEGYINRLNQYYGDRGLTLYAVIGDALDQKSSWRKTMDVLFEVLDNNPELILEYLIECYGIDGVLDALSEYEGQPERFSKGTR